MAYELLRTPANNDISETPLNIERDTSPPNALREVERSPTDTPWEVLLNAGSAQLLREVSILSGCTFLNSQAIPGLWLVGCARPSVDFGYR